MQVLNYIAIVLSVLISIVIFIYVARIHIKSAKLKNKIYSARNVIREELYFEIHKQHELQVNLIRHWERELHFSINRGATSPFYSIYDQILTLYDSKDSYYLTHTKDTSSIMSDNIELAHVFFDGPWPKYKNVSFTTINRELYSIRHELFNSLIPLLSDVKAKQFIENSEEFDYFIQKQKKVKDELSVLEVTVCESKALTAFLWLNVYYSLSEQGKEKSKHLIKSYLLKCMESKGDIFFDICGGINMPEKIFK